MGHPSWQLSPPNLDLRHIQDHFGFTFSRVALTGFSGGFSLPIFWPPTETGRFSVSAGNLLPRFQHGSKIWVRQFPLTPEQKPGPIPRCRDCTIAFINCKSFLPKRNCRRPASFDTIQRQPTKRIEQTKPFDRNITWNPFEKISCSRAPAHDNRRFLRHPQSIYSSF